MTAPPGDRLRRIGVVVHPSRDISEPLDELVRWAAEHGADVVQVSVPGQTRRVAPDGDAASCQVIVSIGGDGTMLAAIRAGMTAGRPVLGVACGSLGILTRTAPGEVGAAMERFADRDWIGRELPGLVVSRTGEPDLVALNDVAVVRAGVGQIRVVAHADGVLFSRIAGDGVIVCTALGSSAYSLAAGGPLLELDAAAFVLTPLATHGGSAPPLVLGPRNRLALQVGLGYGGARLEVDGQIVPGAPGELGIGLRTGVARIIVFADQESLLTVLRERGILLDSPRILAEDMRLGRDPDA